MDSDAFTYDLSLDSTTDRQLVFGFLFFIPGKSFGRNIFMHESHRFFLLDFYFISQVIQPFLARKTYVSHEE
jgi:hypothetical protein